MSVLLVCKTFSVRAINVVSSAYLGERQLSGEVLPSLGGHRDQAWGDAGIPLFSYPLLFCCKAARPILPCSTQVTVLRKSSPRLLPSLQGPTGRLQEAAFSVAGEKVVGCFLI